LPANVDIHYRHSRREVPIRVSGEGSRGEDSSYKEEEKDVGCPHLPFCTSNFLPSIQWEEVCATLDVG